MLRADFGTVRVTADFGASYFIGGQRFVTLILFLKYFSEKTGDFQTECLYNIVTDPEERSEDAFYVRAVWHHHLKVSQVFDNWSTIILERDSVLSLNLRLVRIMARSLLLVHGPTSLKNYVKRPNFATCKLSATGARQL